MAERLGPMSGEAVPSRASRVTDAARRAVARPQPMPMTDRPNLAAYRWWAPVYDRTVDRALSKGRRRAMDLLNLKPGERVLLLGVGTGADLPLLPADTRAVGVDVSHEMLEVARSKLPLPGREITLLAGDAQEPPVDPGSFDAVLLNLILTVVPDGAACLRAALRALKPGGRGVIFDKFLPDARSPGPARRLLNMVTTRLGTDVNRRFGDLAAGSGCTVLRDEPSVLGGAYRVLLIAPSRPGS